MLEQRPFLPTGCAAKYEMRKTCDVISRQVLRLLRRGACRPEGVPATQPSRQFTPGFVLKRTLREAELVILRSIQFGQRLKKGVNTSLNCRLEQLFPKCLKLEVCSGIGLSGYQELERHLWRKVSLAGCRL